MTFLKRYRRLTTTRALKPWSPLFVLDADELDTVLAQGRL